MNFFRFVVDASIALPTYEVYSEFAGNLVGRMILEHSVSGFVFKPCRANTIWHPDTAKRLFREFSEAQV